MQINVLRTFAFARLRFLRENAVSSEKVYHSASELVHQLLLKKFTMSVQI